MDDKRLENLLRLAIEAEDFERQASTPHLKLAGASPAGRRWLLPLAGLMAAAAAAVAIVTVIVPAVNPNSGPRGPIATRDGARPPHAAVISEDTSPVVEPGEFDKPLAASGSNQPKESSVVLAFFEGFDGRCTCLHIQDEEWNGDQLATVDRAELLDVALSSRCSAPAPKILVVAISGRSDSLPRSPEQAEALAAQLSDHTSRTDLTERAYQAVSTLPPGTKVVAESYGNRNTILDQAKWSLR